MGVTTILNVAPSSIEPASDMRWHVACGLGAGVPADSRHEQDLLVVMQFGEQNVVVHALRLGHLLHPLAARGVAAV